MANAITGLPKWDLSRLYANGDHDPKIAQDRQEAAAATQGFINAWSGRSDYLTDRTLLLAALDAYEQLNRVLNTVFYEDGATRPGYYFTLRFAGNQGDEGVRRRLDEIMQWEAELRARVQFFPKQLATTTLEFQEAVFADPRLESYWFWLWQTFSVEPEMSADEAVQLNQLEVRVTDELSSFAKLLTSRTAQVWNGVAMVETPFGALTPLLESGNPRIRQSAAEALTAIVQQLAPEAARQFGAVLRDRLAMARLRGYDRVDVARLRKDGIDPTVISTLLAVVTEQYGASHEYYAFRASLLGAERVEYPQRAAAPDSVTPVTFSFDKAAAVVRRVYALFGPWFVEQFDKALATGRIDAQPRPGKRGGAACWAPNIGLPPYLTLTFTGSLRDVQTLAHEFGHYLEALLKEQNCNSLNYQSPVALAEVCGVLIEFMVTQELLADGDLDDEGRLMLLLMGLESGAITIFRSASATTLERELYDHVATHGPLPQSAIDALFTDAMQAYLGGTVSMEGFGQWWVQWHHLRLGFYNYSYVFAGLVSRALRARLVEDPAFIHQVIEVMGSGTRFSPQELLAHVGIDINDAGLWRTGIESWRSDLRKAQAIARRLGRI